MQGATGKAVVRQMGIDRRQTEGQGLLTPAVAPCMKWRNSAIAAARLLTGDGAAAGATGCGWSDWGKPI